MNGWLKKWILPAGVPSGTLMQRIAIVRGIPVSALPKFIAPTFGDLAPPKELHGAVEVGERLAAAVRAGRKVAIFGDYDADGMCASAILLHLIRAARPNDPPIVYIPERATEGYGLSVAAIQHLASIGVQTIISVDCGVTAIDEAREARRLGLELLITDHHTMLPGGVLPDVDAIAHPGLGGGTTELCGAAVAWKVGWAFCCAWCGSDRVPTILRELLVETLALAAFGTVADVVPLRGENRLIARLGSARIANSGLPGLLALAREAGIGANDRVDAERISFGIAPIVNACGRLGRPLDAVALLGLPSISQEGGDTATLLRSAKQMASNFKELNNRRKQVERLIVDAASARIEEGLGRARGACVLAAPDWPRGVVGIACSRLAEMFAVPVVLMESEGDFAHGSARSVEGYSVLGGLHSCAALLERFGGHAAAAGVAVRMDRLDAFREALSSHAAENRKNDEAPSIRPDVELLPSDLTIESFEALDGLGPFGRTFPAPTVFIRGAVVSAEPRLFGEKSDHLSIFVCMDGSDAREVRCTWWRQAGQFNRVKRGSRLNMMAIPQIDRWNGFPRLAFTVIDANECVLV